MTARKLRAALAFSVAALLSTSAYADVFDFGFSGTNTTVMGRFTATLTGVNTYTVDSFLSGAVMSAATAPNYSTNINSTPYQYGGGTSVNTFQYASLGNFSLSNGIGFSTSAGTFDIVQTGSGTYALQSSVAGANTSGMATLFREATVLGTPGPIAGAGLVPLLGLAGAYVFGRKRLAA